MSESITDAMLHDEYAHGIARVIQGAICSYEEAWYRPELKDHPTPPWESLNGDQHTLLAEQVKYSLGDCDLHEEDIHDLWIEMMKSKGKGCYGGEDNFDPSHPYLVPYDELPIHQKKKTIIFIEIVGSFRNIFEDQSRYRHDEFHNQNEPEKSNER